MNQTHTQTSIQDSVVIFDKTTPSIAKLDLGRDGWYFTICPNCGREQHVMLTEVDILGHVDYKVFSTCADCDERCYCLTQKEIDNCPKCKGGIGVDTIQKEKIAKLEAAS